jgi:hypothetical protein
MRQGGSADERAGRSSWLAGCQRSVTARLPHLGGGVPKGVDLPAHRGHAPGPKGAPQEAVAQAGLVHHGHVVRRRLVVLHIPAVDKLKLHRGNTVWATLLGLAWS